MQIRFLGLALLLSLNLVSVQEARRQTLGMVEGIVRDLNGTAIPEASVYALNETEMRKRITTTADSNGKFVLRNVPPGTFHIHAYKESAGYPDSFFSFFATSKKAWQQVIVESGRTTGGIIIELGPKYATLKLSIHNESGEPVGSALTFTRTDDLQRPYSRGSNGDGDTTLLVPPVPFRLKVEAKGYETWNYGGESGGTKNNLIELRSGETFSVEVRLKRSR